MISLDHVGVIGHSIESMRRLWIDAGFFVTEPEELMALEPGTGKQVSLGQHSCHVILEQGYIELTAVDQVTPTHHLYHWIRSGESLGIIALGADDIESVHRRLAISKVPVGSLAQASRPIRYGARGGDALFTWFAVGAPSTPEALVCFVRNERPELIYQAEVQAHPNGAQALAGVILCASDPAAVAARYAGYGGAGDGGGSCASVALGLWRCSLDRGSIWIGTPAALTAHFGRAIPAASPGHLNDTPRSVGFIISRRGAADAPEQEMIFWFVDGEGS